MDPRIQIICVGSPFGDDRLGWVAGDLLRDTPEVKSAPTGITLSILDRPGMALIGEWQGADTALIIDAIRSGAVPGTLHCLDATEIEAEAHSAYTHGFGVAAAIDLARALGQLPRRVYVCGIEIDPIYEGADLSPPVHAALPKLLHRIQGLIARVPLPVAIGAVQA